MPNTFSFRGIDNKVYYMMEDSKYPYKNYTGCGNTFNCNHPQVQRLVLDSLRHWVNEYHVDGFRFDLTSAMCRDQNGEPMVSPPVIREIAKDQTLARCKLFAEPWDCGGRLHGEPMISVMPGRGGNRPVGIVGCCPQG